MARKQFKLRSKRSNGFSKFARGANTALGVASKALFMAKTIKALINVEKKFVNVTATSFSITNTPYIGWLCPIAQGSDENQRNGNSIKAVSNSQKYIIQLNTAATTGCTVRVILFMDKVSAGTTPSATDLLDWSLTGVPATIAHYNRDNAGSRFMVLSDKRYNMEKGSKDHITSSIYNKLNHHVKFDASTAVPASATTGHLYVLIVSDQTTLPPTMEYSNYFNYIDN